MAEHANATVRTATAPLPLLLVGHALLQMLDLASTYLAIQAGGVEANPLARGLIDDGWWAFAAVKAAVAAAFLVLWPLVGALRPGEHRFIMAAMVGFALLMAAVVANNLAIAF